MSPRYGSGGSIAAARDCGLAQNFSIGADVYSRGEPESGGDATRGADGSSGAASSEDESNEAVFLRKMYGKSGHSNMFAGACSKRLSMGLAAIDSSREREMGVPLPWSGDIPVGHLVIAEPLAQQIGVTVGEYVAVEGAPYVTQGRFVLSWPINAHTVGDEIFGRMRRDRDEIVIPFRIHRVITKQEANRVTGAYSGSKLAIYEFGDAARSLAPFMPPAYGSGIKERLLQPRLLYECAHAVMINAPPDVRREVYGSSDIDSSRRVIVDEASKIEFVLGGVRAGERFRKNGRDLFAAPYARLQLMATYLRISRMVLFFNIGVVLVGCVVVFYGALSLYTLLMVLAERKVYDFAVMRCVGLKRGEVSLIVVGQALLFSIPGSLLAVGATRLLIWRVVGPKLVSLGYLSPAYSANDVLVVGLVVGLVLPILAAVVPMRKAVAHSITEAFELVRRGGLILKAPSMLAVRSVRAVMRRFSVSRPAFVGGVAMTSIAGALGYSFTTAMIRMEQQALMLVLLGLLLGSIVGFTIIALNFTSMLERGLLFLTFWWVRPRVLRKLANRFMLQHRQRNINTSILFAFLMAVTILVENMAASGFNSFIQIERQHLGADCVVTIHMGGVHMYETAELSAFLNESTEVASYAFVSQPYPRWGSRDLYLANRGRVVQSAQRAVYGLSPAFFHATFGDLLSVDKFFDYATNKTLRPMIPSYSILQHVLTSIVGRPEELDISGFTDYLHRMQERLSTMLGETMYSNYGAHSMLVASSVRSSLRLEDGDPFVVRRREIDSGHFFSAATAALGKTVTASYDATYDQASGIQDLGGSLFGTGSSTSADASQPADSPQGGVFYEDSRAQPLRVTEYLHTQSAGLAGDSVAAWRKSPRPADDITAVCPIGSCDAGPLTSGRASVLQRVRSRYGGKPRADGRQLRYPFMANVAAGGLDMPDRPPAAELRGCLEEVLAGRDATETLSDVDCEAAIRGLIKSLGGGGTSASGVADEPVGISVEDVEHGEVGGRIYVRDALGRGGAGAMSTSGGGVAENQTLPDNATSHNGTRPPWAADSGYKWTASAYIDRSPYLYFWKIESAAFESCMSASFTTLLRLHQMKTMDDLYISTVMIKLQPSVRSDPDLEASFKRRLAQVLASSEHWGVRANTGISMGSDLEKNLSYVKDQLTYAFSAINVLVMASAFISLAASMQSNVLESAKDIGIWRAIGLKSRQIAFVALAEAFAVVGTASLTGCLIGMLTSNAIVSQWSVITGVHLTVNFPLESLVVLLLVSMVFALAAAGLPMRRVLQTSCSETLRSGGSG